MLVCLHKWQLCVHICEGLLCAHENIKYKQRYMFSVYSIAPLPDTQVINTSGISRVNITQSNDIELPSAVLKKALFVQRKTLCSQRVNMHLYKHIQCV